METSAQSAAIWNEVLPGLSPSFAAQIRARVDLGNAPPFHDFVAGTIEQDIAKGTPGALSSLLLTSNIVVHAVASPELCPLPEAIRLARAASKFDNRLDSKLLQHLTRSPRRWPDDVPETEMMHALEVIDAVSDCAHLVVPLMKFVRLAQPRPRSKAVKLIARASRNPGWAEQILADPDPRARANLIDGIGTQGGSQFAALLRRGAQDRDHRVAVTSLLALCRSGDRASCDEIRRLASDGEPSFRKSAEWALRQLAAAEAPTPSTEVPHPTA